MRFVRSANPGGVRCLSFEESRRVVHGGAGLPARTLYSMILFTRFRYKFECAGSLSRMQDRHQIGERQRRELAG